ncbi:MAG: APC family permease [Acidobacteriota bacterium]|nr:APC family permease [Acidobacteriota bacterium]
MSDAMTRTPPVPRDATSRIPTRPAVPVFVATTVMLSFISFWRAAAIVLSDLGSSAYYVGGDTEKVIGKSAPWFVLAVMLFSYAVRSVYIESSTMFVRGGVYRVVKEAMGGTLAKLSVSALLFDYVLTGPISAVSAGLYMAGLVEDVSVHLGRPIHVPANAFAAGFAVLVTLYFWRKNTQGMHESSTKALWIMGITTVMVVILIGWCLVTLAHTGVHLPPSPRPANMKLDHGFFGWLDGTWLSRLTLVIVLAGFGHSVLAMSGEETLAQVNREIESPKLKNLERAGLVIFLYSLLFTSLVSFFAVMIIPDEVRPQYFGNLISGLAMYMVGPYTLKLLFQGFVVIVGVLILAGAVNTAIVGSNGVLNRVSEDGVMPAWFRKPHRRYGTSYRLINLIVVLQVLTIVLSGGNVFILAGLYAFGVIWSFAFKALAVLVLRYKNREARAFKVPGNLSIAGKEVPLGLALITLVLFLTALVNLFTKPDATMAGIGFSAVFFGVFWASEHWTAKQRQGGDSEHLEQFRVYSNPQLSGEVLQVRPGNILVGIRDPRNLEYLRRVIDETDTTRQDVVVMTARLYHREHSFGGGTSYETREIFDHYEQQLFTAVVTVAEKAGKPVSLLVAAGSNVFDTIMLTAQTLQSAKVVCGYSNKLSPDEQGKLTGDAWERLPEPKPRLTLELVAPDGRVREYNLGPHEPRLRPQDVELLHGLWLEVTKEPQYASVHHYHIVALALHKLQAELDGPKRQSVLAALEETAEKPVEASALVGETPEGR